MDKHIIDPKSETCKQFLGMSQLGRVNYLDALAILTYLLAVEVQEPEAIQRMADELPKFLIECIEKLKGEEAYKILLMAKANKAH